MRHGRQIIRGMLMMVCALIAIGHVCEVVPAAALGQSFPSSHGHETDHHGLHGDSCEMHRADTVDGTPVTVQTTLTVDTTTRHTATRAPERRLDVAAHAPRFLLHGALLI